jgi:hypothetical protein
MVAGWAWARHSRATSSKRLITKRGRRPGTTPIVAFRGAKGDSFFRADPKFAEYPSVSLPQVQGWSRWEFNEPCEAAAIAGPSYSSSW